MKEIRFILILFVSAVTGFSVCEIYTGLVDEPWLVWYTKFQEEELRFYSGDVIDKNVIENPRQALEGHIFSKVPVLNKDLNPISSLDMYWYVQNYLRVFNRYPYFSELKERSRFMGSSIPDGNHDIKYVYEFIISKRGTAFLCLNGEIISGFGTPYLFEMDPSTKNHLHPVFGETEYLHRRVYPYFLILIIQGLIVLSFCFVFRRRAIKPLAYCVFGALLVVVLLYSRGGFDKRMNPFYYSSAFDKYEEKVKQMHSDGMIDDQALDKKLYVSKRMRRIVLNR